MAKVPDDVQGAGLPKLAPKDYGDAQVLVGTLESVAFRKGQFGMRTHLTFTEFPGKELRQGKRGTDRLVEKFGEETDNWIGEKIPLVRSREEVGGQTHIVYQVAPLDEWDKLLKAHKGATARAGRK